MLSTYRKNILRKLPLTRNPTSTLDIPLDELNALFQGTRYIFTLGENGNTTVQELQEIEDVNTETILKVEKERQYAIRQEKLKHKG